MKNLTLLVIVGIVLMSCKERQRVEAPRVGDKTVINEYPKPFGIVTDLPAGMDHGIVLGSDSHEYLILDDGTGYETTSHYIDCKLCKTRK
jgi:hypothetical protein